MRLKPRLSQFLLLPCLSAGLALSLQAQDDSDSTISSDELRSKINFDESPLTAQVDHVLSYADVLEGVTPGVVTILAKKEMDPRMEQMMEDPMFRRFFGDPGQQAPDSAVGSGVIVTTDGYILTNNHVVENSDSLTVQLEATDEEYPAELIVADPKTDVALIKIEASDLQAVTVGSSAQLRVGDVTLAIGNPFGLSQTVTRGIISGKGRSHRDVPLPGMQTGYADFLQTDASINVGNSGGALIDGRGRLIGINTAIHSRGGGSVGIGFAIPIDMAVNVVERLLDGDGVVRRGFLGVSLEQLDSSLAKTFGRRNGALVAEVVPGTPADEAGLKAYDLIIGFEGREVRNSDRLRLHISNTPPDQEVIFLVVRDGEEIEVPVTLGELPTDDVLASWRVQGGAPEAQPQEVELVAGVTITELTEERRAELQLPEDIKGVLVDGVDPSSAAVESGLRSGLVILDVNQKPVESVDEAVEAAKSLGDDQEMLLLRVTTGSVRSILAVPRATSESE